MENTQPLSVENQINILKLCKGKLKEQINSSESDEDGIYHHCDGICDTLHDMFFGEYLDSSINEYLDSSIDEYIPSFNENHIKELMHNNNLPCGEEYLFWWDRTKAGYKHRFQCIDLLIEELKQQEKGE